MKKIILIFILVVFLLPLAFAASPSANKDPTLKLSQKYGQVVIQGGGVPFGSLISPDWKLAVRLEGQVDSLKEKETGSGSPIWQSRVLRDGDKVITGPNSYAKIILADDSSVIIGPNSVVAINMYQLAQQPLSVTLKLTAGKLFVDMKKFFGKDTNFEIKTPISSMVSRGTKYEVDVQENESIVTVYEGTVEVTSSFDYKKSLIEVGQRGLFLLHLYKLNLKKKLLSLCRYLPVNYVLMSIAILKRTLTLILKISIKE